MKFCAVMHGTFFCINHYPDFVARQNHSSYLVAFALDLHYLCIWNEKRDDYGEEAATAMPARHAEF